MFDCLEQFFACINPSFAFVDDKYYARQDAWEQTVKR